MKAFLGTRLKARPKIESRGFYGRETSAQERQDACRRFRQNIDDFEDDIKFLRIRQREIDAQIASIENALAAMKAPLVRLKAVRLREAVTGKPPQLSPEEQKSLFRALFEGLRQAARFVRRNARDIAEGLYDLTNAIIDGTGSNHTAQVSRKIGELEARLGELRRERERITGTIRNTRGLIDQASQRVAELDCRRHRKF